jgi:vitamin B12 transport system substrate-binding protein
VFYQVWDTPLYTLGGQQIVSDALKVCGAQNLFADLSLPAPQVSIEAVLQRDPDVVLAADTRQLEAWQRWPQMTATARQQLWRVPDKGLERPSWQMLDATERLCEVLAGAR